MNKLVDTYIFQELQKYTCLPIEVLLSLIKTAPSSYKIFSIKKKNGKGVRQICQPSRETKMLQYYFLDLFFPNFPIHPAAKGYIKGLKSPLLQNALTHAPLKYTIHLDFKDFFPSLNPKDLDNILDSDSKIDILDKYIITQACFILQKSKYSLTIGSPVSPIISNIILYDLDTQLDQFALSKNGVYTRYADDIWFSANSEQACQDFYKAVESILDECRHPKLVINDRKTRYYKYKEPRYITGLIVTGEGEVKVPRERKRYLRSLINRHDLTDEEQNYLQGYLAFIYDNEPSYINNLVLKYGSKFYMRNNTCNGIN